MTTMKLTLQDKAFLVIVAIMMYVFAYMLCMLPLLLKTYIMPF